MFLLMQRADLAGMLTRFGIALSEQSDSRITVSSHKDKL